jgi:hypothetical protein
LKLGHSLKKCAFICKANAMQSGDCDMRDKAQDFLELCDLEWADSISTTALRTLSERQWNRPKRLPLAEDITKLTEYLRNKLEDAVKKLESSNCLPGDWKDVAKLTLVQVILFNRRRSGEVERIPQSAYENRSCSFDDDIMKTLSTWEQHLCKSLTRFEIRGKRGRKVPVLLTQQMKNNIDLLIESRDKAGVSRNNHFLFANPMSSSLLPLRGSSALRCCARACGAQKPDCITSTRLRKHIATMSQLLSLKDNELDVVASFMGHDIRIHREYYRLPEDTLQMAKVSKLLMLLDKGKLHSKAGLSLGDVQMDKDGMYTYKCCFHSI